MNETKRVFIKTYGCQMNVYDSSRIADVLAESGYDQTDVPEEADLLLLNTCHIREKAAEKVYSDIGRLKRLKQRGKAAGRDVKIAVAGCVAQAEGKEILQRAQSVDVVVGPQSYHHLPQLLSSKKRVVDTEFPAESKFDFLPEVGIRKVGSSGAGPASHLDHVRLRDAKEPRQVTAFLTVQEGCDKFCTFCVVPYTRGAEFSRPVMRVVEEAEKLAANGVKDVMLLGQNVNAYHGEGPDGATWSLARLLEKLSEIDGLERLRYTTSHPRDMTDDLIAAHRDLSKVMPYLHLPVQSGSDRVLDAMNRKHDRNFYLRLVGRLKEARPDLALSGDFIVGFPGETDDDFEGTMSLVREVRYASAYSFKYSPRPGTPAAEMDQVPEEQKSERLLRLQALLAEQQTAFNASMHGLAVDVLLEREGKLPGQLVGRTAWMQTVQVDAPADMVGAIMPVMISGVGSNTLFGTLIEENEAMRAIA